MSQYKLSLQSKRLRSGKCQIKFTVCDIDQEIAYGYLLSEAQTTLKEVVSRIEEKVKASISRDRFFHSQLYNLREKTQPNEVIIFKQQA